MPRLFWRGLFFAAPLHNRLCNAANILLKSVIAGFQPDFGLIHIKSAIDLDLQGMTPVLGSAMSLCEIAAGIRCIADDAIAEAGKAIFDQPGKAFIAG